MRKLSRYLQERAGSETANNSVYLYLQFLFLREIIFVFAHSFLLAASRRQGITPIDSIIRQTD